MRRPSAELSGAEGGGKRKGEGEDWKVSWRGIADRLSFDELSPL